MIPSYSRKAISGQNNYLGTVISYNIDKNQMDYRGSKSDAVINTASVKEQRVDGSYCINNIKKLTLLRCTLMGGESCYQVRIPSKQIIIQTLINHRIFPLLNRSFYTNSTNLFIYSETQNFSAP